MGAQAVAQVQAAPKIWTPWRLYSRGNDDPNENIYETGKIKIELPIDPTQLNVSIKYAATSTTNSILRWDNNGSPWPSLDNVTSNPQLTGAMPEYQLYQPFLFLQPSAGTEDALVPANPGGRNLGFDSGKLSGQLVVGSWPNDSRVINGEAVIQMRIRQVMINGQWVDMFTDPNLNPPQGVLTRVVYGPVREKITWSVTFRNINGIITDSTAKLAVSEIPYGLNGTQGQIVTPLRIIDTSEDDGDVYKIGYPSSPGVARKDFDPNTAGAQDDPNTAGDQRAEPATPITEWTGKVKARTRR